MVATKCQRIDLTFGTAGRFGDLADDDEARRRGPLLAQSLGPMVEEYICLFVDVVDEDGNVVATYEVSRLLPAADVVGAFVRDRGSGPWTSTLLLLSYFSMRL